MEAPDSSLDRQVKPSGELSGAEHLRHCRCPISVLRRYVQPLAPLYRLTMVASTWPATSVPQKRMKGPFHPLLTSHLPSDVTVMDALPQGSTLSAMALGPLSLSSSKAGLGQTGLLRTIFLISREHASEYRRTCSQDRAFPRKSPREVQGWSFGHLGLGGR